ncbi:MAG: TrbM/KikA/MpfK family conjugal transfer protein [Dehalococcoidia bacterium]|uniref:TrbM/KikA/MpfK family conjugal transfer protein n=1 Tax=unclassified Pseudomonas TaxID=196821 RepID=UPI0014751995|nr:MULTISPECIES: TrbM/KikA/MpfK family conjugal transfer protein [unclassified Pseudomonas]NMX92576.1 hypothetical protein [Pseudomonas sp. WS 5086]NMY47145.1 hypothetical protein [Pseudomonas sp. WS 5027]
MIKLIGFSLALALATSTAVNAEDSSSPLPIPEPFKVPKELSQKETESCEAVICLAGGKMLHECVNPLKVYYDIKPKKRPKFLEICPKD